MAMQMPPKERVILPPEGVVALEVEYNWVADLKPVIEAANKEATK